MTGKIRENESLYDAKLRYEEAAKAAYDELADFCKAFGEKTQLELDNTYESWYGSWESSGCGDYDEDWNSSNC